MKRSDWLKLRPKEPGAGLIELDALPTGHVAVKAAVIAATAEVVSSSDIQIRVYRDDPNDTNPYNVNEYVDWENIAARSDLDSTVAAASTDLDDGIRAYLDENVFLVAREVGSPH